jgi:hypothetical protein
MATEKIHPGKRKSSPMVTKTGKPKLGHLNFTQLEELLNKSTKPKEKVKIQNHITRKTKKQHVEAKL